jgi:hypothetical protein
MTIDKLIVERHVQGKWSRGLSLSDQNLRFLSD